MQAHKQLIEKLYNGLDSHNHEAMAECYHPDATFHDIAFDLEGRKRIHAMWHMICSGDIRATFEVVEDGERETVARLVDVYTFTETKRSVRNLIESRFHFRDGLILDHTDDCDPRVWAGMALGGFKGFLAGNLHFLRSKKANEKLDAFIEKHPEYAERRN